MPPDVISVDPQVFLRASTACADVGDRQGSALGSLASTLAHAASMAGSDEGAREWGAGYDSSAVVLFQLANSIAAATANYAMLLRQAGTNHQVAEAHAAGTPIDTGVPFTVADLPSAVNPPPSSVGDSGPGLQGAIDLASAVGVPCPNGDTGKLRDSAQAWALFESETRDSRRTLLGVAGDLFDQIDSPEISHAYRELRQIADSYEKAASESGVMSRACSDHADRLDESRNEIVSIIEQFAIEEAAAIAVGQAWRG